MLYPSELREKLTKNNISFVTSNDGKVVVKDKSVMKLDAFNANIQAFLSSIEDEYESDVPLTKMIVLSRHDVLVIHVLIDGKKVQYKMRNGQILSSTDIKKDAKE